MALKALLFTITVLSYGNLLISQTQSKQLRPVAQELASRQNIYEQVSLNIFEKTHNREATPDVSSNVRKSEFFDIKREAVLQIHETKPELLQLPIEHADGTIVLNLYHVDLFSDNYFLRTNHGKIFPRNDDMIFYRGIVSGDENSIATVSIMDEEVRILFSTEQGNYRMHSLRGDQYILFMDKDLYQTESYDCGVTEEPIMDRIDDGVRQRSTLTGNCVEIYFECDYESYLDNGSSVSNTEAWVAAIFNEVATIYDNEDIPIFISEIMVWTTTDPYASLNSTSALLNEFVNQTGQNGYTGRLAHLLSTRSLGGGVAYVDVLCSTTLACAVSASLNTNVILFPNYSWNVNVVAHEMGHNFGSSHTHACVWNGNNTQIDDCGSVYGSIQSCFDPENPILPEDGTIMSYCHLIAGVGINFSLGFGPQPGDRIRFEYQTASCNTGTCTPPECTVLSSPAALSTSVDVATNISWAAVMGADGYLITVGTSTGSGNIVDNLDVGQVLTFNPASDLEFNTIIYVTIAAYNSLGSAIGCAEEYFTTEENVAPTCTQLTSPLDGATNVPMDADLFWTPSEGNQLGYKITLGTTPGGGEILDHFDVGNVVTYNPGTLPASTTLYTQITPYGVSGDISGCIEESFTTSDPVYCTSKGSNVDDEWIAGVAVGAFSNPSGAQVYSNFTNLTIDLSAGVTYPVSITAGYSGQAFNEYFRVWIDINHDGIFQDPAERVFQKGPIKNIASGNLSIPITAYIGTTRMRVAMKYSGYSTPCQTFPFGEVEDYTVNIRCNTVTTTLDGGPGSLSWAVGCATSGDTISFSASLNGDTIIMLDNHALIDVPLTIAANPASDISVYGFSVPQVFYINQGVNATISGLNIIAGTAMEGSAVQNMGSLSLENVAISNHPGVLGGILVQNSGMLMIHGDYHMIEQ